PARTSRQLETLHAKQRPELRAHRFVARLELDRLAVARAALHEILRAPPQMRVDIQRRLETQTQRTVIPADVLERSSSIARLVFSVADAKPSLHPAADALPVLDARALETVRIDDAIVEPQHRVETAEDRRCAGVFESGTGCSEGQQQ